MEVVYGVKFDRNFGNLTTMAIRELRFQLKTFTLNQVLTWGQGREAKAWLVMLPANAPWPSDVGL